MKRALGYTALLLFVLIGAQVSAYAQDGPDNEHPIFDDKVYNEAPIRDMDGEGDNKVYSPVIRATPTRDSSASKITTPTPRAAVKLSQEMPKENKPNTQPTSGDDSILSFNFIYYIIQRFKLQDIIE